jgi:hypoxanthine phosphoribosyltransferase
MSVPPLVTGLQLLFSQEQIAARVAAMGADISRDFRDEQVLLLGVLKGAAIFLSDLARQLTIEASFDFLGVSSYGKGTKSSGEVRLTKDIDESLQGKNVILVEDILDTGLTLNYLKKLISAHQPRTLRIAALLDKPSHRVQPVQADYLGFTIEDFFVVGYGMDCAERYRNLPDICILSPEMR